MTARDNDKVWEDRADRAYDSFTRKPKRTALKWFAAVLGVILALSLVFGAISWVSSWGGEAKRVTGVENVREQNTQIIEAWEGMEAAAANVCSVGESAGKSSDQDPTLVEDPTVAYKAKYRSLRVDYNRRMANLYEAQAVRNLPLPSNLRNYPEVAPTLEEKLAEVCPS